MLNLRKLERDYLAALTSVSETTASAGLFFGGRAVAAFQDLVANEFAHEAGGLGQRGEEDEARFESAIESIDGRFLAKARDVFAMIRQDGATFRLVAGDADLGFDTASVERGAERGRLTTIDDSEARRVGVLVGLLPQAHLFEFRADADDSIIRGKVDPSLAGPDLMTMNRQWLLQPAVAVLKWAKTAWPAPSLFRRAGKSSVVRGRTEVKHASSKHRMGTVLFAHRPSPPSGRHSP